MINEPTHIWESLSCTDLIFNLQPNLISDLSFHPSLHANFYHQIIFQTLAHNAKTNLIRRATNMLDWDSAFVINKVTEKVFNF